MRASEVRRASPATDAAHGCPTSRDAQRHRQRPIHPALSPRTPIRSAYHVGRHLTLAEKANLSCPCACHDASPRLCRCSRYNVSAAGHEYEAARCLSAGHAQRMEEQLQSVTSMTMAQANWALRSGQGAVSQTTGSGYAFRTALYNTESALATLDMGRSPHLRMHVVPCHCLSPPPAVGPEAAARPSWRPCLCQAISQIATWASATQGAGSPAWPGSHSKRCVLAGVLQASLVLPRSAFARGMSCRGGRRSHAECLLGCRACAGALAKGLGPQIEPSSICNLTSQSCPPVETESDIPSCAAHQHQDALPAWRRSAPGRSSAPRVWEGPRRTSLVHSDVMPATSHHADT